jgi:hypothetical protein
MGKSKNTLKKNGLSQLLARYDKKVTYEYHNNDQHIEYNHFNKMARFLQCCVEAFLDEPICIKIQKCGCNSMTGDKKNPKNDESVLDALFLHLLAI